MNIDSTQMIMHIAFTVALAKARNPQMTMAEEDTIIKAEIDEWHGERLSEHEEEFLHAQIESYGNFRELVRQTIDQNGIGKSEGSNV